MKEVEQGFSSSVVGEKEVELDELTSRGLKKQKSSSRKGLRIVQFEDSSFSKEVRLYCTELAEPELGRVEK